MPSKTFENHWTARLVSTLSISGVTSAEPARLHKIPRGSLVRIYPTSAGTAAVYNTITGKAVSDLDTSNSDISNSNNAEWDIWGAGSVSAKTSQQVATPLETVALVVASGTWTIEVAVDGS